MRTILAASFLFLAQAALAQSFLLQRDGSVITIAQNGYVYDLDVQVTLSEVGTRGKNWFVNNGVVTVVDKGGLVVAKPEVILPRTVRFVGGHWLFGDTRGQYQFMVFASNGNVVTCPETVSRGVQVVSYGANWAVVRQGGSGPLSLITIDTAQGACYLATPEVLTARRINVGYMRQTGGNWFIDQAGYLHAITRTGSVITHTELGTFLRLHSHGGNFFVDSAGQTRVVMDNGWVLLPNLPLEYGPLLTTGAQHAWSLNGTMFTFAESVAPADERRAGVTSVYNRILSNVVVQPTLQVDPRTLEQQRR